MKIREPTNGVSHAPRGSPQEPSGLKTAGIAVVVEFVAHGSKLEDGLRDLFDALAAGWETIDRPAGPFPRR
jgi:hypothetical protein